MIQIEQPKDLAVKNQNALAAPSQESATGVLPTDFVIPYMVIVQSMSESFTQKKAGTGDIIRSTTCEKLGGVDEPVEIVVLSRPTNKWVIEERPKVGQRFEFRKEIPRDAANDTLPWSFWMKDDKEVPEGTKGATEWRRVKILKFFALVLNDLKNDAEETAKAKAGDLPDLNKVLMPVVISFRSTSYKAGKLINNLINKAATVGVPLWRYHVPLAPAMETNDQGTFYVWMVDEGCTKPVPEEYIDKVTKWAKIVNSGQQLLTDDQALAEDISPTRTVNEVC